jgi:shikimate 5-dehydrogenase
MLVRQGALAFSRWTGRDAPLDVMYAALQTA